MPPSATDKHLPEDNQAPPSYSQATQPPSVAGSDPDASASSKGKKSSGLPVPLPSVDELNSAFSNLNIAPTAPPFPNEDLCFAHLKLLHTFYALKEDVGYTDGIFGLWDSRCEMADDREAAFARMREKRWVLFIARAVERFETWWINYLCAQKQDQRLTVKDMVSENLSFKEFPARGTPMVWDETMLPPLGTPVPHSLTLLHYAQIHDRTDICLTISCSQNYIVQEQRLTIVHRCPNGVARFYAESPELSGGLHPFWTQGSLDYRHAMESCQRCHRC